MKSLFVLALAVTSLAITPLTVAAANLTIPVSNAGTVSHIVARYQCDAHAAAMGLPSGPFQVDYINAGPNSLAVLPINGHSLIFSSVMSASGSRYAAEQYVWWDAGSRGIHLYANPDSLSNQQQTSCQPIK